MSLATKQQMSRHPNITVLSQQDLERRFRKSYPWRPLPSPLSLVKLYVETEKPKNLMLDEVPLETSWCRELLTFAMRTVLSLGIQKSTALSLFFFTPVSLIFLIPFNFSSLSFLVWAFLWTVVLFLPWLHLGAKVSETVVFLASSTFIALFIMAFFLVASMVPEVLILLILLVPLAVWLISGILLPQRFHLSKTSNILLALPPLLLPEANLWIALHSAPLTDNIEGLLKPVEKEKVEDMRSKLRTKFCCPSLRHNLRNSYTVATTGIKTWSGMIQGSKALPCATPPPSPPSLTDGAVFKPLLIPLSSPNQLGNAVAHAYTRLGKPEAFVVLLDNMNLTGRIEMGLKLEGVTVTSYNRPEERVPCEAFLSNPVGAFITTGVLFSGMEASCIIWVTGDNSIMVNSNKQRAIEKICVINTDMKDSVTQFFNMSIESTFAKCQSPWLSRTYQCQSCTNRPVLCPSRSAICHPDCRTLWVVAAFLFQFLLPSSCSYNPCSCASSGICKLKK